jgi:hypothetical protein
MACNAPTCGYPDWTFTDFTVTPIWRACRYQISAEIRDVPQIGSTKTGCVRSFGESRPNFSQHPALLLTDSRPFPHRTQPTFSHSVEIILFDQRFTERLKLNPKQNYFYPQRTCFNSSSFTAPFWLVKANVCPWPPCCETPLMR